MSKKILVIFGATASGKTALSLEIAKLVDHAEIISVDSRQIYKELDIGTAKPTAEELNSVQHHFISELPVTEEFSVGKFFACVKEKLHELTSNGKTPIMVGGATLYLDSLFHGLSKLPPSDESVRSQLEQELRTHGSEYLYERLKQKDPDHAKTLDHTKTQRLVRSLELIEITGLRVSDILKINKREKIEDYQFVPLFLDIPRSILYQRINNRVDVMMKKGLWDEARSLYEKYADCVPFPAVLNTIGYKELFDIIRYKRPIDKAIELIKQNTRRYAKRQLTFFRNRFTFEQITTEDFFLQKNALLIKKRFLT